MSGCLFAEPKGLMWLQGRLPEMMALLEEIILINSHTANKLGVDDVEALVKRELQELGMRKKSFAQPDHGDLLIAHTPAVKDGGNIQDIQSLDK